MNQSIKETIIIVIISIILTIICTTIIIKYFDGSPDYIIRTSECPEVPLIECPEVVSVDRSECYSLVIKDLNNIDTLKEVFTR